MHSYSWINGIIWMLRIFLYIMERLIMNKKILVFLLVAIVALSLSAVSAADNTTDDVSVLSSYDDNAVVS